MALRHSLEVDFLDPPGPATSLAEAEGMRSGSGTALAAVALLWLLRPHLLRALRLWALRELLNRLPTVADARMPAMALRDHTLTSLLAVEASVLPGLWGLMFCLQGLLELRLLQMCLVQLLTGMLVRRGLHHYHRLHQHDLLPSRGSQAESQDRARSHPSPSHALHRLYQDLQDPRRRPVHCPVGVVPASPKSCFSRTPSWQQPAPALQKLCRSA